MGTSNGGPKCKVCGTNEVDQQGQTCDQCKEQTDKLLDDLKKDDDNNGS